MARDVADPAADLDKDGQTSLLRSVPHGVAAGEDFYKEAGRLATEHSLIDDNGGWVGDTRGIFSEACAL